MNGDCINFIQFTPGTVCQRLADRGNNKNNEWVSISCEEVVGHDAVHYQIAD